MNNIDLQTNLRQPHCYSAFNIVNILNNIDLQTNLRQPHCYSAFNIVNNLMDIDLQTNLRQPHSYSAFNIVNNLMDIDFTLAEVCHMSSSLQCTCLMAENCHIANKFLY